MRQTEADKRIIALATNPSEPPSLTDRQVILAHLARAKFSDRKQSALKCSEEGHYIIGMPHPKKAGKLVDSLDELTSWEAHTVQRIREGRWPAGTNVGEYLADLRAAAGHPDAQLYVGVDLANGRPVAGTLTPLNSPGLRFRKASNVEGMSMVVVYEPTIAAIRTGFFDIDSNARKFVERWKPRRQLGKQDVRDA